MTWPYHGAPGNPVLAAYVGGFYQDILMFDHSQTQLQVEGRGTATLALVSNNEFSTSGDSESMQMTTSYRVFAIEVVQTVRLNRGSQTATISYSLHNPSFLPVHLDLPLLFCVQPKSISIDANLHSMETVQDLETPTDGVVSVGTMLTIDTSGGVLSWQIKRTSK